MLGRHEWRQMDSSLINDKPEGELPAHPKGIVYEPQHEVARIHLDDARRGQHEEAEEKVAAS